MGDLYFNGVATDVNRIARLGRLSGRWQLSPQRPAHLARRRDGAAGIPDGRHDHDGLSDGQQWQCVGPAFPIVDNGQQHATFFGVYLQDEWKIAPKLTLNYGARFDVYSTLRSTTKTSSARASTSSTSRRTNTTLHAGYARYFTPPPVENVSGGTRGEIQRHVERSPPRPGRSGQAERANYFDAGISQKFAPGLQGVDGYYKHAQNQIDDGLFGQTLILSAFNYAKGEVYGVEFTGSYTQGGLSTYANLALSKAWKLLEVVIYDWPSAHAEAKFSSSTYPLKTSFDPKAHALHVILSDVSAEAELTIRGRSH